MSAPVRLEVATSSGSYPVVIGSGVTDRLSELTGDAEHVWVITDAAVGALHAERAQKLLGSAEVFTLEPGEGSKTVATAEVLWRWMAASGAHRSDVVVALGGGVVGDLAGFVAATYHRGVAFIQVPTTLLAQVDASIGGKTAVDLPEGKNLVGAFHPPRAVLADVDALMTLPQHAFDTGLAEVIKHGLLANNDLHVRAGTIDRSDPEALTALVADAARVKIDVVQADERESGARAHLNYGHTLGHALEVLDGYAALTHGEAISIGMMFVAHLAASLGHADLVQTHRDALEAVGLPTGGAGRTFEDVSRAWLTDKKFDHGARFVLLEDLGKPVVVGGIDEAALRAAYEAVR